MKVGVLWVGRGARAFGEDMTAQNASKKRNSKKWRELGKAIAGHEGGFGAAGVGVGVGVGLASGSDFLPTKGISGPARPFGQTRIPEHLLNA